MDAGTSATLGESKQAGMGNVPSPVEIFDVSICHKSLMSLDQPPEGKQNRFRQVSVK
jgi:hypothetical protein